MVATTGPSTSVRVLSRALDQTGDALDQIHGGDDLARPTPCGDWKVWRLADHLVFTPTAMLRMMRGESVDWSTDPPHVTECWGPTFRVAADDLIHAWHAREHEDSAQADWQTAELAVHTWDLLVALDRPVDVLDPEVAERALEFMRANLTAENRGGAFGPEQRAPDGAGPYQRLAAYAGRRVG